MKKNLVLLEEQKKYLTSVDDLFEIIEFEILDNKKFTIKDILTYSMNFLCNKLLSNPKLDITDAFEEAINMISDKP